MATSNLISKSIGDILTQSGNGSPDHTSPKGSLYVDQTTALLYMNNNGATSWRILNTVAYFEAFYQDNLTATTIGTSNWVLVNNTLTAGLSVGFTVSGASASLSSGYDGIYHVRGDVTIAYVTGTNNYEVGLSINNANPASGRYNGNIVDITYTRGHIGFESYISLVGGDNIKLSVRNITSTSNVIIRHAQIYAKKVG